MKAKVYRTTEGYTVVTGAGKMFSIVKQGAGYSSRSCGTVGDNYKGCGVLLREVPDDIKHLFFSLQKTDSMQSGLTFAPSIANVQGLEVMNCGLLIGYIEPDGNGGYKAAPYRYKHATFDNIDGAKNYFSAITDDCTIQTIAQPVQQGSLF